MKKTNMMTKMTTIGIDYSLTCPAVCVYNGSFENSKFYYVTTKRKYEGVFLGNITGHSYKDYNDDIERYKNLSDMVLHIIEANQTQIKVIFLEGYSFGSKGRALFNIAENGGILKYRLKMAHGCNIEIVPPANIKKFATGKGNADKEKMYDQFYEDTGVNLMEALDQTTLSSPVTDIVDSYYIAKYGTENTKS